MSSQTVITDQWSAVSGGYRITNLDAKVTGATTIFTVPSGFRFHPTRLMVVSKTVDTLSGNAQINVGSNDATYNNIISGLTLSNLGTANTLILQNVIDGAVTVAAGTDIKVNVTTGATATTFNVDIILFGILL